MAFTRTEPWESSAALGDYLLQQNRPSEANILDYFQQQQQQQQDSIRYALISSFKFAITDYY
jgi:hypothetical protein